MREFKIQENDANQRVDKFIEKTLKKLPKTLMYKSIRNKKIKVNRKRCEISQRLQVGDTVQCFLAEEFFEDQVDISFLSVPSQLDIIYEDHNVVIVNKPSGLLAHKDEEGVQDTLADRFLHYLYDKKEYDPYQSKSFRPALCHRIDRNTQGIVMMAKNAQTLRDMNMHIKDKDVHKYYMCIVENTPTRKQDNLILWHKKGANNKVEVIANPKQGYQKIETAYRVLKTKQAYSLVEIQLKTGKSHQIRAVMSYLGCPLYGDIKYGAKKNKRNDYQALCAYKIYFAIPDEKQSSLKYLDGKTLELEQHDLQELYQSL